jgi:hypothetical protein
MKKEFKKDKIIKVLSKNQWFHFISKNFRRTSLVNTDALLYPMILAMTEHTKLSFLVKQQV